MKLTLLISRWGRLSFLVLVGAVVAAFLLASDRLIDDLAQQERARMQVWADATREIVAPENGGGASFDFLLSIIEANTSIPVVLTDADGNIVMQRNFHLPHPEGDVTDEANLEWLQQRVKSLRSTPRVIDIEIMPGETQHLYYEDSSLLTRLSWFPYVQLAVMLVFVALVYYAVVSVKKAEQNRVWVGLSKETAHQLGTPISSLMAWLELLRGMDVDPEVTGEMDKDVKRLATIASRFGKIGSAPTMEPCDINTVVGSAAAYMSSRISKRISLTARLSTEPLVADVSAPLLEWVMENLIKNAVDAIDGQGHITVITSRADGDAVIEVSDTGRGMTRQQLKLVFEPGYTTKKRGWGLGLTLARRIIEEYHGGRIRVAASEPGAGTTFKITLPLKKTS